MKEVAKNILSNSRSKEVDKKLLSIKGNIKFNTRNKLILFNEIHKILELFL